MNQDKSRISKLQVEKHLLQLELDIKSKECEKLKSQLETYKEFQNKYFKIENQRKRFNQSKEKLYQTIVAVITNLKLETKSLKQMILNIMHGVEQELKIQISQIPMQQIQKMNDRINSLTKQLQESEQSEINLMKMNKNLLMKRQIQRERQISSDNKITNNINNKTQESNEEFRNRLFYNTTTGFYRPSSLVHRLPKKQYQSINSDKYYQELLNKYAKK